MSQETAKLRDGTVVVFIAVLAVKAVKPWVRRLYYYAERTAKDDRFIFRDTTSAFDWD